MMTAKIMRRFSGKEMKKRKRRETLILWSHLQGLIQKEKDECKHFYDWISHSFLSLLLLGKLIKKKEEKDNFAFQKENLITKDGATGTSRRGINRENCHLKEEGKEANERKRQEKKRKEKKERKKTLKPMSTSCKPKPSIKVDFPTPGGLK